MSADEIAVWRLRNLARRNCPECGATFGHATECSVDTEKLLPPVEWPKYKMREFHEWLKENKSFDSFEGIRCDARDFLHSRYPNDHDWALRAKLSTSSPA